MESKMQEIYQQVIGAINSKEVIPAPEFLHELGFSAGTFKGHPAYMREVPGEGFLFVDDGRIFTPEVMRYATIHQHNLTLCPVATYALPLYKKEFPEFGVMTLPLPENFEDSSLHNEACPSWRREFSNKRVLRIWVHPEKQEDREDNAEYRFSLALYDHEETYIDDLVISNEWEDILAGVKEWIERSGVEGSSEPKKTSAVESVAASNPSHSKPIEPSIEDYKRALTDLMEYVGGWDEPLTHPCGRAAKLLGRWQGR